MAGITIELVDNCLVLTVLLQQWVERKTRRWHLITLLLKISNNNNGNDNNNLN